MEELLFLKCFHLKKKFSQLQLEEELEDSSTWYVVKETGKTEENHSRKQVVLNRNCSWGLVETKKSRNSGREKPSKKERRKGQKEQKKIAK